VSRALVKGAVYTPRVAADVSTAAPRRAATARAAVSLVRFAPVLLGIVLVLPSLVWAALDRSIWPWDPAWYGSVSLELAATFERDLDAWGALMTNAFGQKPPAVAWFGQLFVPLGDLFGQDEPALLISVLVCLAATLALVYAAVRRLAGNRAALVATLLLAAAPVFVSMSHEYFAEPIQTVALAWLLYILASAASRRPALTLVQIPGVAALGMLAKLSSPVYMAVPIAAALVLAYRHRGDGGHRPPLRRDRAVVASGIVSLLAIVGAVSWYRVNLDRALDHARLSSADTGLYGTDLGFARQLPDWIERMRDVAFLPYFWLPLAALAVVSLALAWRNGARASPWDPRVVASVACLASIVLVLTSFATQPNQEMRYLLGLVPFLALAVALAISAARVRALVALAVAVLAIELVVVTLQGFGYARQASLTSYPVKELTRTAGFAQTLENTVADTCGPESAYRINMVGADYPWLNHNYLSLLAIEEHADEGLTCYYTALGYAEGDPEVAWKRLLEFKSPYYISIDYGNSTNALPLAFQAMIRPDDPFNQVNRAVFARVMASGLYKLVPGSRRDGLVILRLTALAE